jgi:F-type H+-transporting ATPase subunit delta
VAETLTIARPYAEAVFALAHEKNRLDEWARMLDFLAAVSGNEAMQAVINDPNLSEEQIANTFLAIGGEQLDGDARNFVQLLAHNDRLSLLPEISQLFGDLKSEAEGVVEANIASAYPLTESQLRDLVQRLEKKFKHRIDPQVTTDRELIGGVKVEVGDEIWDASVKGKLENMGFALARA